MGGEGDVRATRAAAFAAEATVSALEAIEREQTLGGASTSSPPTRHQAVPEPVHSAASIPSTASAMYRLGYGA